MNWAGLAHAYGPAADVPGQIRDLLSPDASVRERALWSLHGNIYHQGTIYQATAHAVPFLLEVLESPECRVRAELLVLLTGIVTGFDEMWLPEGMPVAERREQAIGGDVVLASAPGFDPESWGDLDDDEPLSDEDMGRLYSYIWVSAYDAVRAGVPLFRRLLRSEPAVRCMAAYALAWFPEDAEESLRALAAIPADGDGEGVVAATASVATGLLGGRPATGLDDPRPLARWGAAIALATVECRETPDEAVEVLVAAASGEMGEDERVPFLDGNLAAYAGAALRLTGDRHADRTLDALLGHLSTVSGVSALHVLQEALQLAFPSPPQDRVGYPELDDRQRRLAGTLAASPQAWLLEGRNFGNIGMLLFEYKLPSTYETMREYVTS
ncbi:hypothetical protein SAMN05216553_11752 [Lentzea fradiae]|uniref:HEAT repeat-containing protein n=1 Tax=Lentzea fradiae TaxID=200378 RepID=A0A1G8A8N8_9PSEU|nr:hypothetical protein SAMN05216553_11752 [Lentzea fradiae]